MGNLELIAALIILFSLLLYVYIAFKQSVLWGIGAILIGPPVTLIFTLLHWDVSKKAFFIQLFGFIMYFSVT